MNTDFLKVLLFAICTIFIINMLASLHQTLVLMANILYNFVHKTAIL